MYFHRKTASDVFPYMNDENSNCMVFFKKKEQKHHETNNGWRGREGSQTRDSDREGTMNASPRLVPSARTPALPLLSGLSKVLRSVPRAGREECYCHIRVSSFLLHCPVHPGEGGCPWLLVH